MKAENSMDMIKGVENTVVISGALGHGCQTKKCAKCGRELPTSSFAKRTSSHDGLQEVCRECKAEYMREYMARKKQEKNETKVEKIVVKQDTEVHTMIKVYSDSELARFTPRQLMAELKARGYRWDYMLEPQRKIHFDKI